MELESLRHQIGEPANNSKMVTKIYCFGHQSFFLAKMDAQLINMYSFFFVTLSNSAIEVNTKAQV